MTEYRTSILSRMFIVLGLVFLIPFALAFQLIRINYIEGEGLRELWSQQAIDEISIPAKRGNIYDSNGTLLVTNTTDYQIAVDPKVDGMTREKLVLICETLALATNQSTEYYLDKIDNAPSRSRYIVLAKNLNAFQKEEVENLAIRGIILEEDFSRKYTFGTLASHSLGFVNHNMDGRTGIEAYYNETLSGIDGVQQVRKDPFNRISQYVGAPKQLPQDGYSLHTTVDSFIQAILEDELKAGVEKHLANYGTGIIMDPKTGAIIAMANYPTFNPNAPGLDESENRRNFAISDMIEPGSTFKLVTAIAAVEQNKVDFDEIFETPENGEVIIHGLPLRDHDPLGNMTFEEVIQKSSNVATAEIAMRLDNNKFYQYARNMGFGTPTYVDIFGEESGRMAKPYEWSLVSLPWMSHGYELLATPIQIAQSYSAFANGGTLMRPYIVERIEDSNGNIIEEHEPLEIRSIAKERTIEQLLPIFESVVSDSGTGDYAMVDGLRIAGKTGTAKKVINGRYTNRYRGSFAGFFPVEDPKYVIYILLDEPKTSGYGGFTAGPIFRQIALRISGLDNDLQESMITHTSASSDSIIVPLLQGLTQTNAEELLEGINITYKTSGIGGFVVNQTPGSGTIISSGDEISLSLSETNMPIDSASVREGFAIIPNLDGMNMRNATNVLVQRGFEVERIGSGTVFAQFPRANEWMREGGKVTIRGRARSLETVTIASNSN